MKYLADMGVSRSVANWLRSTGADVIHLADHGLQRVPDGEIFRKAIAEQRVVITFDLDFGEILALSGSAVVSVVLFRLNNAATPFVIKRLQVVLPLTQEALAKGAVVVIEDERHRVRKLPIGA